MNNKTSDLTPAAFAELPSSGDLVGSQSPKAKRFIQMVCIWSGIPMVFFLFVGLWPVAGFIPPLHPWAPAADIAEIYRTEALSIRFGLAMSFISIMLILPFGSAIAAQTRRIEGQTPILTYIQIAGYSSGTLVFVVPWISWFTAAFRPERSDSEILLLNDFGWMFFVTAFIAFFAWNFALGAAILTDARKKPIYPRWSGYFNFFVGMSFVPDICVPFFQKGIFSWEGIFPFYLPFFVYFCWILTMIWLTHVAIKNDPDLNPATR